ncbi:hypothetical protein MHBO_001561 [Bonamia ostreae]|uniref:Uncharacterized protein n=1 Tax=Bonamia ostreae TaxID=126728 RepID=A0ABV2AJI6_9EUKA
MLYKYGEQKSLMLTSTSFWGSLISKDGCVKETFLFTNFTKKYITQPNEKISTASV